MVASGEGSEGVYGGGWGEEASPIQTYELRWRRLYSSVRICRRYRWFALQSGAMKGSGFRGYNFGEMCQSRFIVVIVAYIQDLGGGWQSLYISVPLIYWALPQPARSNLLCRSF